MFDRRVLPIGEDVMIKWRLLIEDRRKAGHTFSQSDLIIAATALRVVLAGLVPATNAAETRCLCATPSVCLLGRGG